MTERTFRSGYKIIVEGDIGHECFILAKGSARVTKWQPEVRVEVELTTLTAGDIFGEAALLNEGVSQRGATITSTGPCHCFLLSRERFRTLLGKERLNVQFQKRAAISDNVGAANKLPQMPAGQRGGVPGNRGSTITSAPPGAMKHKNAATQAMLLKVVKDSVLFANVDEPQMKGIVDTMWLRYVAAGEIIIQQGDIGEHWYVIDNGAFDILITPKGGGPMTNVGTRERGAGVGELALLYNAPRAATIRASRAGAVWVLDRFTYRTIMTSAAEEKRARYEAFLKGVKGFDVLIASERAKLADALEEVSFDAGVAIVTEGEMGDTFYIILSGVVVVSKQREGELIRLKEGDYFGERAVVKNEPRAATCTASTKVTCLFLKSEAFKDLLGSMDEIFQQRQDIYKTMLASAQAKSGSSPADLEKVALEAEKAAEKAAAKSAKLQAEKDMAGGKKDKHLHDHGEGGQLSHLKLDDLKVIGTLGKGSFGTVQLVKEKGGSGATYALKIVSKQAVVDLGQQEHIMNEKRCMSQLNHPFLVRLFATFKDADRLYFLQEACLGGELFTVLRAKSSFPESVARFYAASVVLAFEYMHAKVGFTRTDAKKLSVPNSFSRCIPCRSSFSSRSFIAISNVS